MDEATIKQMMVEYKQAWDKIDFLADEIRHAVIKYGQDVQTKDVLCKYYITGRFGEPWAYLILDITEEDE